MSMTAWPEPVQRVAMFLRDAGAEARLEEFPEGTPTARDAARAIGCRLDQIVKAIVFEGEGRGFVALVPGDRRADAGKIARAVRCDHLRVAGAGRVKALTSFAPGAVAPFPLPGVAAVVIERTLLRHEIVWVGAGSARHMVGLAPAELVRLARAEPMDAVESGT